MKQLITHEHCLRCRECCRFREDRQYFAPLFTADEIEAIRQARSDLPEFAPYQDSDRVYQIRLKRAEQPDPVYPYVCPFLDEASYRCTIYDLRPFDCRTWPFIVHRLAATGQTVVAHFTGDVCLALREVPPEDFAAYRDYFAALLASVPYVELLRRHPELVWTHDEDGAYHTVPIADITVVLNESPASEPAATSNKPGQP